MPDMVQAPVPKGLILLWSGSVDSIPNGFQLCDGKNGTPDLRDRFVVGAGSALNPGDTGGSTTHTHEAGTLVTGVPTLAQLAAAGAVNVGTDQHTHTISGSSAATDGRPPYYALAYIQKT